mmetsp:Transcript_12463/g.34330  ORF Transcript_12463/g.34330 Transcript_12463/m.34330 type:complete len:162 (+) Transcript_12463:365-850(+)
MSQLMGAGWTAEGEEPDPPPGVDRARGHSESHSTPQLWALFDAERPSRGSEEAEEVARCAAGVDLDTVPQTSLAKLERNEWKASSLKRVAETAARALSANLEDVVVREASWPWSSVLVSARGLSPSTMSAAPPIRQRSALWEAAAARARKYTVLQVVPTVL